MEAEAHALVVEVFGEQMLIMPVFRTEYQRRLLLPIALITVSLVRIRLWRLEQIPALVAELDAVASPSLEILPQLEQEWRPFKMTKANWPRFYTILYHIVPYIECKMQLCTLPHTGNLVYLSCLVRKHCFQ